jgi:hypothetical protein
MAKMARIAPMMTGVFQVGVTDEVCVSISRHGGGDTKVVVLVYPDTSELETTVLMLVLLVDDATLIIVRGE